MLQVFFNLLLREGFIKKNYLIKHITKLLKKIIPDIEINSTMDKTIDILQL